MSIDVLGPLAREKRSVFFRLIFGKASGYACIAFLSQKKKFREEWFRWPEEEGRMLEAVEANLLSDNVYFCSHLFQDKTRTKENVTVTPVAWADLDFCKPGKMLVEPSIVLETSPDRYQAFWRFLATVDPDDAEDLSRRIAYKHADQGADRSGWDLTQLLRVPYTFNYKYGLGSDVPVVEFERSNDNIYRIKDFEAYPASPQYSKVDIPMPEIAHIDGKAEELLQSQRMSLNPLIWPLFSEEPAADVKSWSEILWRFLMLLFEQGFSREQVFVITQEAKCNKYARDGKPLHLLWKEVCRAEGRAELHQKLLVPNPEEFEPLLSDAEKQKVEAAGDTFIERYITWASGLGDAAPQYHQAGAFVVLSSLLAGSVRLPTSYGLVVPNIWFMILADTTLTRKTTSMDIAMDLISDIDDDIVMATDGSLEGLLTSLAARPGKPSVFLRDEFSGLLEQMTKKDYMAGMPELLTKLYDGKMQKRVLRKEIIEVRDPRLIVFAGGIKNRVTGGLNFDMVSSGFMPRFVFITAESDLGRVRPIGPPTQQTTGDRDAMLAELLDLGKFFNRTQSLTVEKLKTNITKQVTFDCSMSDDAWVRYNKVESQMLDNGLKAEKPDIMTPVGDRLAKSVLKAAILIAASRQKRDNIVVEEIDILRALKYGEQWSAHVADIMQHVGKGSAERQLDTICNAIRRNPQGISRSHLMQAYHLTARDANQIFDTLEQRGMVRRQRAGKTELLTPTSFGMEKPDEEGNGNRKRRS